MKLKKILFQISILLVLIILGNCKKDDTQKDQSIPPVAPNSPAPSDKFVFTTESVIQLSWISTSNSPNDTIVYDVYLGKSQTPELVASSIKTNHYNISQISNNSTYYWKIVAKNKHNETSSSPLWSFSMAYHLSPLAPSNPYPSNQAVGAKTTFIKWASCINTDHDSVFYDLYLDTISSPKLIAQHLKDTSFNSTLFLSHKRYYWKIVAKDNYDHFKESPVWSFVTDTIAYSCKDYDGYAYKTVLIGNQLWMVENLRTTHYNNGDQIETTTPLTKDISGEASPKYMWAPNNNENNVLTMGRLYTKYVINDNRGVCPSGFHVPTNQEWETLATKLGGSSVAGGKLKEIGTLLWNSPNAGATNSSGFSALPAGGRSKDGANFFFQINADFWSNDESATYSDVRWLYYADELFRSSSIEKNYAISVRCVKD